MEPKITVRPYRNKDWDMVLAWWDASAEVPPLPTMMPEESSFIAEIDGVPSLAIALYLTNTKDVAYVENFIGNPDCKGPVRREASKKLIKTLCDFASTLGFRNLIGTTHIDGLKNYYTGFEFNPVLSGITLFVKELR